MNLEKMKQVLRTRRSNIEKLFSCFVDGFRFSNPFLLVITVIYGQMALTLHNEEFLLSDGVFSSVAYMSLFIVIGDIIKSVSKNNLDFKCYHVLKISEKFQICKLLNSYSTKELPNFFKEMRLHPYGILKELVAINPEDLKELEQECTKAEQLVKKSKYKNKSFNTILDFICNFLCMSTLLCTFIFDSFDGIPDNITSSLSLFSFSLMFLLIYVNNLHNNEIDTLTSELEIKSSEIKDKLVLVVLQQI